MNSPPLDNQRACKLRRQQNLSRPRSSDYACWRCFDECSHASVVAVLQGHAPPRARGVAVCLANHGGRVVDPVPGVFVRPGPAQVVDHGRGHHQPATGRHGAGPQLWPSDRHHDGRGRGGADHGDLSPGAVAVHHHSGVVAGVVHRRWHFVALYQFRGVCPQRLHRRGGGLAGGAGSGRHVFAGGDPRHGDAAGGCLCVRGQPAHRQA
ncbi:hypothetical protein D3C72_1586090 [compost metagenome]